MPSYSNKQPYPTPPAIRKLGTLCCDIVETTPIVFGGELYRFEYVRSLNGSTPCFRLVHVRTNHACAAFAQNHHMGSAFTENGVMYASGVADRPGGDTLHFFRSDDLDRWTLYAALTLPGCKIFNSNICRMGDDYILLIEVIDPALPDAVPFSFRFARSRDLAHWTMLPPECVFQPDRYAGGPAIYTLPGDPYYYVLYLEAYPREHYATCIARSADLIEWDYSPVNPVLMYEPEKDKRPATPFLTPAERARVAAALDVNNSDVEMCEYLGRTIIYYSWGNQHGNEFLAEACCERPMAELLHGYFA